MSKTYKLITDDPDIEEDQKTVEVSEDVKETKKEKTSVAQLKEEHQETLDRIQDLATRADKIVDELKAIDDNISEIAVDNIPSRVVDKNQDKPVIPPKK